MKVLLCGIALVTLLASGCTTPQNSQYSQELIANEQKLAVQLDRQGDDSASAGPRTFSRKCHVAHSYTRTQRWFTYGAMAIADFFVPSYSSNDDDEQSGQVDDSWDDDTRPPDIVCSE